ncbi:MAG: SHOCT domain-containing protein [Chloroflexota bacterium]|nr:SHOCT domain-containing protein [Chloroflexota bacterium]
MMWGYNVGWGGVLMSLGMVLWIALLTILVWAVIRWLERKPTAPTPPSIGMSPTSPSALEILQQRYARGEIDAATFEQMRECVITSHLPPVVRDASS